jgi:hypothetical protein
MAAAKNEQREGATNKNAFQFLSLKKCFAAVEDRPIYFLMFYGNKFAMIVRQGTAVKLFYRARKTVLN